MKQSYRQQKATGFVKACLAVYFFRLRYCSRKEHTDLARIYVREARGLGWRGRVSERKRKPAPAANKPVPEAGDAPSCKVIPFVSREERNRAEEHRRIVQTILEHAEKLDW